MRLKHNKKRNTAFVYEALVRELTESVVKNNKNKQNKIVSIIKQHFNDDSTLRKELDLYKSIYETRELEKNIAEKIVTEVKKKHIDIDKKTLFKEQSALINTINKTLSNKVYNNFVPNFKTIASVYSIFQDALPVKDRVLLEENIVNEMSSSVESKTEEQKPMDYIVYNSFVKEFNKEYSEILSEAQKTLLNKYISSFTDNEIDLKIYLNEEIGRVKQGLIKIKESVTFSNNSELKSKVEEAYKVLDNTKEKQIDTETLEVVLSAQQLLEELETYDS